MEPVDLLDCIAQAIKAFWLKGGMIDVVSLKRDHKSGNLVIATEDPNGKVVYYSLNSGDLKNVLHTE